MTETAAPAPEQKTPEQLELELARLREEQQLQAEISKRKAALEYKKRHFAISYYAVRPDGAIRGPHPNQQAFHADPRRIRVASGGNRSGKSTAGINEDVAHSLGYRPWLPKEDPNYKVKVKVPNKGLICGESFQEQVKKVIVPKLLGDPETGVPGAIPTHELAETKKNPQGVVTYIKLKNGSQIFLQSYDQPVELFESADYDWFHGDEPPPRPIWVAVQRGLTDREGRSWLTMTPLKEAWLYDEVYSRGDVGLYYFDIEDNLDFGLTRQGIDDFASNLTEDEKEARLRGRYFHLTGLVYKLYGQPHKVKRFPIPRTWGMWMHIDTHPRTPHHAVFMAVDPQQRKYICGALKNGHPTNAIDSFAEAMHLYIRERLGDEKKQIKWRADYIVKLIDPFSQTPDPMQDGRSMWDEFADLGFRCKPGSKNRDSGILLFQKELFHDLEKKQYPNVFVFDDLEGVDYELRHYVWDDWSAKAAQNQTEKQTPKKKNDHFIEGIHRILLDEPYCDLAQQDEDDDRGSVPMAANASGGPNPITGY
jgi:hypothetical protein